MTSDRFARIETLYHAARARAPEERVAYLMAACGTDEALRREVESLLAQPGVGVLTSVVVDARPALANGTTIGPYRILEQIGEGGMGEVYRAHDTKLGRDVALKVLPQALASDRDRLARLEREARLLASLNHANIAQIHGLEEASGQTALVMELVEGETLAERVARGPLPINEALAIARQMCEALEAAHDHGIIHRDLKPANVKVRPDGTVKMLDFGLARVLEVGDPSSVDARQAPTLTAQRTRAGVILGTPAYMSPEQALGKPADRRADIWAFGAVLYELLAGRHAFRGDDISDTLAAVLKEEPDWTALPEGVPGPVRRLLRRCLEKDARQRLRAIGNARLELDERDLDAAPASAPQPPDLVTRTRERLLWALTAVSVLVALSLAVVTMVRPSPTGDPIRMVLNVPVTVSGGAASPAVSPDGRRLAFVGNLSSGRQVLWLQSFNALDAQPLPGTDGAFMPFWSPDSRTLGFFAERMLKTIDVSGGPPVTLTTVVDPRGGTWNREGMILFAKARDGIYRVSNTGGDPVRVTTLDPVRHESNHWFPTFLPDGRHFLYLAETDTLETRGIRVGSLDSRETTLVTNLSGIAKYAWPGYLIFNREGTLMAQAFNDKQMRLTGEQIAVGPRVGGGGSFLGAGFYFSASNTGVLAYQQAGAGATRQLVWWDRNGRMLRTLGDTSDYGVPAISPNGAKVAVSHHGDIWVYDVQSGQSWPLTFGSNAENPVWSADGLRILFTSRRKGPLDVHQKAASGVGAEEVVLESSDRKWINDVSTDGRYIVTDTGGGGVPTSLWVWPLVGDRKAFPFVQGSFAAQNARLSPDNHWIAYSSDETGRSEVWVESFPEHRIKKLISTSGGTEPMWRQDGRELFYLNGDTMMAVEVKSRGDQFEAGSPRALFRAQPIRTIPRNRYVVTPDGQRFLINSASAGNSTVPVTVVFNWPAVLKH